MLGKIQQISLYSVLSDTIKEAWLQHFIRDCAGSLQSCTILHHPKTCKSMYQHTWSQNIRDSNSNCKQSTSTNRSGKSWMVVIFWFARILKHFPMGIQLRLIPGWSCHEHFTCTDHVLSNLNIPVSHRRKKNLKNLGGKKIEINKTMTKCRLYTELKGWIKRADCSYVKSVN